MSFDQDALVEITDEIYLWVEQGSSIQLKAVTPSGDPTELTGQDARQLARTLLDMAALLEE